jgi:hypothetical protein
MKQGWETLTLLDVEQMWKQKQQKMMNELPKPRFTQRDIIDKRVYIPSPGARHARAKKAKLIRTYSVPSTSAVVVEDDDDSFSSTNRIINSSSKPNTTLYFHHYHHNNQQHQWYHSSSHHMDSTSSSYSSDDGGEHTSSRKYITTPTQPPARNSLDYLSYAIAMTEEAEHNNIPPVISSSQPLPDISEIEPNLIIDHQQKIPTVGKKLDAITELDVASNNDNNSPPSSPATSAAAKAIMMFVNSSSSSQPAAN